MKAWETYKGSENYANSKGWALKVERTEGSMWAAFLAGWLARYPDQIHGTAPLQFTYKNWRGEVRPRSAYPIMPRFGTSEWHKEPQWLLLAKDAETGEEREFAMKDMAPWGSLTDNFGLT